MFGAWFAFGLGTSECDAVKSLFLCLLRDGGIVQEDFKRLGFDSLPTTRQFFLMCFLCGGQHVNILRGSGTELPD